jgi:zinc D-Ala-D-Ala dipeptidase
MNSDSWRIISFILLCIALSGCAVPEERRSALVPSHSVELAKSFDLVDVRATIPDIAIDLRYATADNVVKRPIYPARMPCLLRVETAEKLKTAQALLRAQGYGLRIWDAYRPPEAQETLHRHAGSTGMFLSPEASGWSRHCGGIAVDLTLVDAQGHEQRMPTYFDQDFANASRRYRGSDPVVKQNLQILQAAMKQAGFIQLQSEWWHFDDKDFLYNPQPIIYGRQLAIPML